MCKRMSRAGTAGALVGLVGALVLCGGCDANAQATVANGIISSAGSLATALVQAWLQQQTTPAPSNTTSDTGTNGSTTGSGSGSGATTT